MIKKLLGKLIAPTLLIVLAVTALPVSAQAITTWNLEKAGTGMQYSEGLGYDADGNPGIAQMDYYTNPNHAIYRYKSASGWVSEEVGDAYGGTSLAYNSNGQPAMLYKNYSGSTSTLTYAKRISADNWAQETVVTGSYISSSFSLAFNSTGNPCFSYSDGSNLYYVAYNGSTWNKQTVYSVNDLFNSDLAFNGSTPAIAFGAGKEGLKYAYYSGGKWVIQAVDTSFSTYNRSRQSDITLCFGNGKPLISYNDLDTRSLKFAYSLDGNWVNTTVEASTNSNIYTGDYATMQVAQGSEGYVIYIVHSNFWNNKSTSIKLKTLAVNSDSNLTGLGFTSQTLYTGYFRNMPPLLASALKDGNPCIVFLDFWASKTTLISMQPDIVAVSSVAFGAAAPSSSASRVVTITNNGSLSLSISEIVSPSAPFSITGGDFTVLAPGQSGTVTVHFEPTAAGVAYQDTLAIQSNDPDHPVFNISLSGRSIGDDANLSVVSFNNGASQTITPDTTEYNLPVEYATSSIRVAPVAADVYAQIKVNGTSVQSGKQSGVLSLDIGSNTVTILVTSENGANQKTYTLNITRKDSPDARLSELTVSAGELLPAFSPEILSYSMTLPDGVSSVSFTPTASQGGATISINGAGTANGSASETMAVAVGSNTYTVHVLAPDTVSTMDYQITVLRLPELSGISLDHGTLEAAFDPYVTTYTAIVPNSASAVTLTPTADATYSLYVNGKASSPISLQLGDNTITVEAVSADGTTMRTYTLTVTRLEGLTALSVGDTPVFFSEGQFQLSAIITQSECPIIFSAPEGMSVDIGVTAPDGISAPLTFEDGENAPITINLTSPECTEPTVYTLTVTKLPRLTGLEIADSTVTLWEDETVYVQSVANTSNSVTLQPTANSDTTIALGGNFGITEADGLWTIGNLHVGSNPIYVTLTSLDGKAITTYLVIIQRLPGIASLTASEGNLNPIFNVNTYNYTVNVGKDIESISFNAVLPIGELTGSPVGSLSINGATAYSDCPTDLIGLSYGSNIIPVVVTVDNWVSATYTITVVREEPLAASVSPAVRAFDKNADFSADVNTVITWNDATAVSDIEAGGISIGAGSYSISDIDGDTAALTIKKEYLAAQETGSLALTVEFDKGDTAGLSINITNTVSGGNLPLTPSYNAGVNAGGGSGASLPIIVNTDSGSALINIGNQSGLFSYGTVITAPSIPGVDAYSVGMPVTFLSTSDREGMLTLNTDAGSVSIPSNMLTGVSEVVGSGAEITIGMGDKEKLPDDVKGLIGDRPLIQLTLSIDGKQTDWSNPDAFITVSIPYTPTSAELLNPESIVIWYIDGSGNVVSIPSGHYSPETGMVTFGTTHFSNYAVAYNKMSFNDVTADVWYGKAVSFIAARGITSGTGNGNYSPEAKLTRGEFIVLMMRAYGIVPDENPTDNFSDAGSTYYTAYLAAAKQLGISEGVGNNMFAPSKQISRQEMFTLLYNALKVIEQLPKGDSGKTLHDFTDAGDINPWAKEAMTLLVETGAVGGNGGKITPAGTTTRAEMAQVLYNLMT